MKIGKNRLGFGFQRTEKKEERERKKNMACERWRAATSAGHALTIGWSNAAPARRRHMSPASRAEPRREPSRPGWVGRPRLCGSKRVCSLRLAPSCARDYALPARCWRVSARGMANLARLFFVCLIFVPVLVLILFLREKGPNLKKLVFGDTSRAKKR